MARLWMAGAEIDGSVGTATQNQLNQPDGQTSAASVTRDTATYRSGAASYKCNSGAGDVAAGVISPTTFTFTDGVTYYARTYLLTSATFGTAQEVFSVEARAVISAQMQTNGTLRLAVNSVLQTGASAAVNDGGWHRVELKAVATATGNWTAAELVVDGSSVATWSGTLARAGLNNIILGWATSPGANTIVYFDDVALNDSTGASNNSYPGSGKVVLLLPTADSAAGNWTNDAGGTSSLMNAVNNRPPVGIADTTSGSGLHQIRSAVKVASGDDNYDATMTTYTAAGVGASDTVNAIQPFVATAAPVTTGSLQGTVGVASNPTIAQIALSATGTSGAFWAGAAAGTFGAGWKWTPGTMTEAPSVTLGTAPVMRITKKNANSTRIAMTCAMFIYVDYTPAPSGNTYTKRGYGVEHQVL